MVSLARWNGQVDTQERSEMKNKYVFLAFYYIKNIILMRCIGRFYGLFLWTQKRRWDSLRESLKHNDTWLVVGNGPSLDIGDLESLSQIPAIASNKINILYGRTSWRPAIYTIADPLLLHKLPADHYDNLDLVLLPHTHLLMARGGKKLTWRHVKDHVGKEKYDDRGEEISPLNGLFVGGTITCPNIQLAMWAGAKTIYVIGCDHFYSDESSVNTSKKSPHHGTSNHFDPNYRKPGEIVNEAPVDVMNRSYALLRKLADARGVKIINISRQTALEAFERDTVENALAHIAAASARSIAVG
jgi:hypothetical protein